MKYFFERYGQLIYDFLILNIVMIKDWIWLQLDNPLILFFSIIFISYIWEDGALFLAAGLYLQDELSFSTAYLSIFIGLMSGDYCVYLLGRTAKHHRSLYRYISSKPYWQKIQSLCSTKSYQTIFIARCLPGFRTITYMVLGYIQLPHNLMIKGLIFSGAIWISAIFALAYIFKQLVLDHPNLATLLLGIFLLIILSLIYLLKKTIREKTAL